MAAPLPARPTSGPCGRARARSTTARRRLRQPPRRRRRARTSRRCRACPTTRTARPTGPRRPARTPGRAPTRGVTPASRCAVSSPAGNPTSPTGTIATSSAYGRVRRGRPSGPSRSAPAPAAAAAIPSPTTLTPASTTRQRRHSAAIAPGPRTLMPRSRRAPVAGEHPARAPREHPQVEPLPDHGERAGQPHPPAVGHGERGHDEPQVPGVVALDGERLLATEQVPGNGAVPEADPVRACARPRPPRTARDRRTGPIPRRLTTRTPGDGLRAVREHLDARGRVHLPAQQRVADRARGRARSRPASAGAAPAGAGSPSGSGPACVAPTSAYVSPVGSGAARQEPQPEQRAQDEAERVGDPVRRGHPRQARVRQARRLADRPPEREQHRDDDGHRTDPQERRGPRATRRAPRSAAAAHQSPIVRTTAPTSSAASETK